ncbi:vasopressin V2 receptor-like [Lethenteron reissneri]|uniref:vasopressin V2 receptor-like n=1 Tax=Lethenteron reissneri TaxID=7753 RepID=UPI002AB6CBEE|nr:vasopressin V2 receptor-like [Lethenteron reissneri]
MSDDSLVGNSSDASASALASGAWSSAAPNGTAAPLASRPERDEALARAEVTVLGLIFVLATSGNATLLVSLWRRRKHASRMHAFLVHLSVADLVVAFFQVLPQLAWDVTDAFQASNGVCKVVKYLQVVGMFASAYMIVAMTVDRFQAVCYPMVTFKKKRSRWNGLVCAAWATSLALSTPQIFIFSLSEYEKGIFDCTATFAAHWGAKAYVTWVTLAVFVLPTLAVVVCQAQICRIIRLNLYVKTHQGPDEEEAAGGDERRAGGQLMPSRASSVTGISRAMINTVRMTLVIVLVYVACWAPWFTVQLWSAWDSKAPKEGPTFVIIMLLGNLNSCTNPWIYLWFAGGLSPGGCRGLVPHARPPAPDFNVDESVMSTATFREDRDDSLRGGDAPTPPLASLPPSQAQAASSPHAVSCLP